MRVSVITRGAQHLLELRWIGEDAQLEAIAQEFKAVLNAMVGTAAKLSWGNFESK